MRVLVIGINGFLGSRVARRCRLLGWRVDGVYHRRQDQVPPGIRVWPVSKLASLPDKYDIVFLLAAKIVYGDCADLPATELISANVELPLLVVKHFRASHIVYSSSVSVYGQSTATIREISGFQNPNIYGLSKLAGECVLQLHPSVSIVRLSNLYGKGMNDNLFIAKIVSDAKNKKKITLIGKGERVQDYFYIEDAARLCMALGEKRAQGVYLGVYGRSYSNKTIARLVAGQFPPCRIVNVSGNEGPSFRYDNSQSRQQLGVRPHYSPALGIAEMIKELYG